MPLLNIKAIRLAKGWGQDETAKKLKMSRPWYSLLENGRLVPTNSMRVRIEKVFEKTTEELLSPVSFEKVLLKKGVNEIV